MELGRRLLADLLAVLQLLIQFGDLGTVLLHAHRLLPEVFLDPRELVVATLLLVQSFQQLRLVLPEFHELIVLLLHFVGLLEAHPLNRALIVVQFLLQFVHLLLQVLGVGAAAIVHCLDRCVLGAFLLQLAAEGLDIGQMLAALLLKLLIDVLE